MNISTSTSIMLLGYRGAGKTTLATHLSQKLQLPVVSTDKWIEEKHSCSIATFVSEQGWDGFRREEVEAVRTILGEGPLILDGGGGMIENLALMDELVTKLILVYIKVPLKTILARLEKKPRPRLTSLGTLEAETRLKLAERIPLYEKYAHLTVKDDSDSNRMAEGLIHKLLKEKLIEKKGL